MTSAIVPKELLTATPGGLSLLVVSGGADGYVLTQQADGTYAPEVVSGGIGGSVGATDNRLVRSDGTGASTVQSTGITADDSNNVSGVGTLGCGAITTTGGISVTGGGLSGTDGWKGGSYGSGYGAIWPASVTPGGSNYSWLFNANGMSINCAGGTIVLETAAVGRWQIRFDGTFAAGSDNAYDIGEAAARRPKNIYLAGQLIAGGMICVGVYTFATVPSASANTGKFLRISDRAQKHAYSDGTDWRFFGDDAIIS